MAKRKQPTKREVAEEKQECLESVFSVKQKWK